MWNIDNITQRFIPVVIPLLSHLFLFTHSSSVGGFGFPRVSRGSPPAANASSKCWAVHFSPPSQRDVLLFYNFHDLSRKQRNSLYKPIKKCEPLWTSGKLLILMLVRNDHMLEWFTRGFCFVVLVSGFEKNNNETLP